MGDRNRNVTVDCKLSVPVSLLTFSQKKIVDVCTKSINNLFKFEPCVPGIIQLEMLCLYHWVCICASEANIYKLRIDLIGGLNKCALSSIYFVVYFPFENDSRRNPTNRSR